MYNNPEAREALWHEACLAARIRHAHRVVTRAYDDALRAHELTTAQLDLLMTLLTSASGMRRIDLARAMEMERSTVTRTVERLAARGLVRSIHDDSAGGLYLEVTPAGRQAVDVAADAWFEAQRATRDRLGEQGVAALELITQRLSGDDHA